MNAARKYVEEANPFRAILDRWTPFAVAAKVCHCRECKAARKAPFLCEVCGYNGPPQVWACECPEHAAKEIARFTPILEAARAGKPVRHPYNFSIIGPEAVAKDLEEVIRRERRAGIHHRSGDEHCGSCHGHRDCPVCGIPDQPHEQAGFFILRDLRAALTAAGLI